MASEWSPQIRVNAIAPGTIETTREATEKRVATMRQRVPMGRMGQSDEIAKTALFMASDLASYVIDHADCRQRMNVDFPAGLEVRNDEAPQHE